MGDYVNSLERDLDIIEGQIALAQATGCDKVAVPVETLKRLLAAAEDVGWKTAMIDSEFG